MYDLIQYLIRRSGFIAFVIAEAIAIHLIVSYNMTQRENYITTVNLWTASMLERVGRISDYFHLQDINDDLSEENARLLAKIHALQWNPGGSPIDSVLHTSSRIISNQITGRYNRILLDKGSNDGLRRGMGIAAGGHPVGIVDQVVGNFATGISILNADFRLSASIKHMDYFGVLSWNGKNIQRVQLEDIPAYAGIEVGDTVVTSGYGLVFPEGMTVGLVEDITLPSGSDLAIIEVFLFADIARINYVTIIDHHEQVPLDSLQFELDFQ